MRPTRPTRLLLAVPVLLLGLAGCGDDGAEPSTTGTTGSSSSASTDSSDTASGLAAPENLCELVTAEELSAALGATVTTEVGPSGDCEFAQEDPRALRGSIGVVASAATNGGYEGYVSGVNGTLKDPTDHPVAGLTGDAVVKVGLPAYGGSENLTAAGVAARGSFLLTVTLVQGNGMSADALAEAATKALELIDGKVT